jgi:hypothetical protein
MPATGSIAQRLIAGLVGARKLLASDESLGATAVPGSVYLSERSCCARRVVRHGRTLVRSRGGTSGPQVPRRGTCKGACPGQAPPTTPRPGFNDAFNDAPGRPPNRAVGPHRAVRTRPAAHCDRSGPGTATIADHLAALRFPGARGSPVAPNPLAQARAGTVARRVRCRAHRGSPSRLRASSSDSTRATCRVGHRVPYLPPWSRDRRPPRPLTFA